MSKVLEFAIHSMVSGYLDETIKYTLRVEQGGVHITNMLLRAEVFNDALKSRDLPFMVTLAYCGDLLISLPWLHWSTGTVVIEAEEIYVQLRPTTRPEEMDVDLLRQANEVVIQRAVDALIAEPQSEAQEKSPPSMMQRMTAKMKRQLSRTSISIDVGQVHVQLADRDFDGGMLMGQLRIFKEGAEIPEAIKKRAKSRHKQASQLHQGIHHQRRMSHLDVAAMRGKTQENIADGWETLRGLLKRIFQMGGEKEGNPASSIEPHEDHEMLRDSDGEAITPLAGATKAAAAWGEALPTVNKEDHKEKDYAVELINMGLYCTLNSELRAAAQPLKGKHAEKLVSSMRKMAACKLDANPVGNAGKTASQLMQQKLEAARDQWWLLGPLHASGKWYLSELARRETPPDNLRENLRRTMMGRRGESERFMASQTDRGDTSEQLGGEEQGECGESRATGPVILSRLEMLVPPFTMCLRDEQACYAQYGARFG